MGADLIFSANVVVPIFLLIILGYVLTRIKLWDEHFLKIANQVLSYYKKDSLKDIKSVYADEFLLKLHQTSKNKRR